MVQRRRVERTGGKRWSSEVEAELVDTCRIAVEHMEAHPTDLRGLLVCTLLSEAVGRDLPGVPAALWAHADRFSAMRSSDDAWKQAAREVRADIALYDLGQATEAGAAVQPVAASLIAEFSRDPCLLSLVREQAREFHDVALLEKADRALRDLGPGYAEGKIDEAYVPADLAGLPEAKIAFHPSGHLREVSIRYDDTHQGWVRLEAEPGAGRFWVISEKGGYGYAIEETYSDGNVEQTFYSPWHDGAEGSEECAWPRWVLGCLQSLVDLVDETREKEARTKKRSKKSGERATGAKEKARKPRR